MNYALLLLCLMTMACSATKKSPHRKLSRQQKHVAHLQKEKCVFCLDPLGDLAKGKVTKLNCAQGVYHRFHTKCLEPWKNQHHNCPTCRRVIPGSIDAGQTSSTSGTNNLLGTLRNFFAILYERQEDLDPERRNNILIALNDVRPDVDIVPYEYAETSDHEYGLLLGLHTLLSTLVNSHYTGRFAEMENISPINLSRFPTNLYHHWQNCTISSHVSGIEDSKLADQIQSVRTTQRSRTIERTNRSFIPDQFIVPTIADYRRLAQEDRSQNNRS